MEASGNISTRRCSRKKNPNIGNTTILNLLGNPENFENWIEFLNQIGLLNLI